MGGGCEGKLANMAAAAHLRRLASPASLHVERGRRREAIGRPPGVRATAIGPAICVEDYFIFDLKWNMNVSYNVKARCKNKR